VCEAKEISGFPIVDRKGAFLGTVSLTDIVLHFAEAKSIEDASNVPIYQLLGRSEEGKVFGFYEATDRANLILEAFTNKNIRRAVIKGKHWRK